MPFLKNDFIGAVKKAVENGMVILAGSQCRYEGSNLSVYETGLRALESGVLQAYDMTAEASHGKTDVGSGTDGQPERNQGIFFCGYCGRGYDP